MTRVAVRPEMLRWAVERAGTVPDDLQARFAKFPEWLEGEVQPTLKQLENFAKAVHVPIGYLFLPSRPMNPCLYRIFGQWTDGNRRARARTFWK